MGADEKPPKSKFSEKAIKQRERAFEGYKEMTGKVSELIRYIGFGLLAAFYTTRPEILNLPMDSVLRDIHLGIGLSAVCIIVFDYLHYTFGSLANLHAAKNVSQDFKFKNNSFTYRMWIALFYVKQVATAVGSILIALLVLLM